MERVIVHSKCWKGMMLLRNKLFRQWEIFPGEENKEKYPQLCDLFSKILTPKQCILF